MNIQEAVEHTKENLIEKIKSTRASQALTVAAMEGYLNRIELNQKYNDEEKMIGRLQRHLILLDELSERYPHEFLNSFLGGELDYDGITLNDDGESNFYCKDAKGSKFTICIDANQGIILCGIDARTYSFHNSTIIDLKALPPRQF